MAQGRRYTGPGALSPEAIALFIGIGLIGFVSVGTWIAAALGAKISGVEGPGGNPFRVLIDVITGEYAWPGAATAVLIGELVVIVLVVVGDLLLVRRMRGRRSRVDRHAALMSKRHEIQKITRE